MRWVRKTRIKLFRRSFSTGGSSRKSPQLINSPGIPFPSDHTTLSTGPPSRKTQSKKLLFNRVRKPDLGFSRKRPFSTDKSDCVRTGPNPTRAVGREP